MLDSTIKMQLKPPVPAFYSYAHKNGRDRKYLDELLDALAYLVRQNMLDNWDDRKIRAGQLWEELLLARAEQSRLFVLIVTNRFISSTFSMDIELVIARRLYESRHALIAPVIAEESNWEIKELKDLQVILPFDKPVIDSRRDRSWTEAARMIGAAIEAFLAGQYFPALPAKSIPVPRLMPHTIGRIEETDAFAAALRGTPRNRPFVCVLTGEGQGQSEFIENLMIEGGVVRSALDLSTTHHSIELDGAGLASASRTIESSLNAALAAELLSPPRSEEQESIAASIAKDAGLTVVTCEFSAEDWRACSIGRRRQFLEYWANWPELKPNRNLIIFVVIRAEAGIFKVPGGICIALPSVRKESVLTWLETPTAKDRFKTGELRNRIGQLFATRSSIPMDEFAGEFLGVLRELQL